MKLKNLVGAFVALAGIALCGTASAVGNGNVYEFRPITPVNTADTAFGAAQKIEFLMRLISPNPKATPIGNRPEIVFFYRSDYDTDGTPIPSLDPISHAATLASIWQRSPLRLGIVVSGQKVYCDLTDPIAVQSRQFYDITCSYVTKFGDLALPVRLAMEDSSYVFENDGLWGIGYVGTDGKMHEITPSMFKNPTDPLDPQYGVYGPDMPRNGSYDLMWGFGEDTGANKAYFIRTVGFDTKSVTDEDGTWWRTVNEGRTTYKPDMPTIVIDDLPEKPEDLYLYVWSEDDTAVTMKVTDDLAVLKTKYNVEKMTFLGKDHELHDFWVKRIKIDGNNTEYAFDMKGVTRGKPATIVLKAEPGYTFHETTTEHDLIVDYLSVQVKCTDPLPPTVMVKVTPEDTVSVKPMTDVQTRVATLTVELSDPYPDGDVTVDVGPYLAVNGVAGESATNYFGISEKTETMSYLDKVDSVTFTRGDMSSGFLTKTLYVYAWGADAKTYAVDKAVAFVPSIADATVRAFFVGGFEQALLKIKPIKPTIVEPVEGKLIEVNCSVPYSLRIVVNDTYNDMRSTNGFEVLVKHDITQDDSPAPYNDGFISLGRFAPDADGVLYSIPTNATDTAKLPQVTWENTATEHAMIYLRSPESKEKSEERTIDLVVKPARQIQITATDGREGNQYVEGEDVSVDIELLNAKNDTGDTIYAFLVPQGEATNAVSATWLAQPGCTGRPIPKNGYLASGLLTLLDGTQESKRGATYDFKVELRTKQSYSAGVPVPGYESLTLTVFSQNVIPSIDYVEMNNGNDTVYASGDTFELVVPEGVTNWFQAFVTEPGEYDKTTGEANRQFETRWRVTDPTMGTETFSLFGDPDTNKFGYAFTAGKAKIEIDLKDKDMTRYGDGELNKRFTFYVTVIDNPTITVGTTKGSNQFDEIESEDAGGEAALTVDLTLNQVRDPLVVELTLTPPGAAGDNPGKMVLQTNSTDCIQTSPGVYRLTFGRGVKQKVIGVKTLDGTPLSRTTGFRIESRVLGAMVNGVLNPDYPYPGVPGQTCAGYYVGLPTRIQINNVQPQVDPVDLYPEPGTTNRCAIGQADAISWNFTDVLPDFTDNGERGITVTVKGGTEDGKDWVTNVTTQTGAAGSFTPTFTKSGVYTVKLTIKDKDDGPAPSFVWYYDVEVSKTLIATPHGPTGGKGGANATRYSTAPGLGEGHVYGGEPSAVSGFESTYNCQLAKRWTVWAFGYKVGTYDDGTLDGGKDFALSPSGGLIESGLPDKSSYYKYPTYLDKNGNPADSFRYTWLQILSGEDQAGFSDAILNSAFSPEQAALAADAGQPVALPTELLDDKTYDDAMLEAIFSVEYLASDNMGDINQDRIPDLYVNRYGLGVVDTVTKLVAGDDLKAITLANNGNTDEDFLPGDPTAFSGHISGLEASSQKAFTADYEIRGFGEALNDAPIQIGLKGVKPDRIYEDPDLSPTSTLSKVEFLAWSEYKAAHPGATVEMWSPERPTDPMEPDTDDDGFTDGYEYYFWYLAHVGYIDANGIHRYLTGRAYDPRNPGEGRFIPSEEIAERMDPQVKYTGSDAETRDTDNDGLPDKLEFEIGTNPFDFDTDGDGLPDGWEIMISGTNPLKAYTTPGICDAMRNFDGDAMAFTTAKLESGVLPLPFDISAPTTFALIQANGMSDGVQWYADVAGSATIVIAADEASVRPCTSFTASLDGKNRTFVTVKAAPEGGSLFAKDAKGKLTLALDLMKDSVWEAINLADEEARKPIDDLGIEIPDGVDYIRLMPVNLLAGTPVSKVVSEIEVPGDPEADPPTEDTTRPATCVALVLSEKVTGTQAAWTYGSVKVPTLTTGDTSANKGGFGMLALGKYLDAPAKAPLAALPKPDENLAFLHYLVYQQYGFDPRTAWNAKTPLADRWGSTAGSGENKEAMADKVNAKTGYAGQATRTREYTAYDEFLVFSFFLNNGMTTLMYEELGTTAPSIAELWYANTTNPQGPGESDLDTDGKDVADEAAKYWGRNSDSGADTDMDGVPDGWELYVMSGPKQMGKFVFPAPYDDAPYSNFSPFVPNAKSASLTDNTSLSDGAAGDGDSLTEFQEFEGTDTMAYYRSVAPANPTIVHDATWTWFNKFFPTDPWNEDTDQDGLKDGNEIKNANGFNAANFLYADVDTGKTCVPGGGLNPCSVDTDQDGLPDGWEAQFAGSKVSVYRGAECQYAKGIDAEGNEKTSTTQTLQGLSDGMDGTVKDAYNYVRVSRTTSSGEATDTQSELVSVDGVNQVVDRDYDHDGLENWQEYLVGTMRCWRYDDPISPWLSIPTEYYFDEDGIFNPFREDGKYLRLLGINPDAEDGGIGEFWYRTLFDKTSKAYNPHLVTGSGSASFYFSRVTNGFDPNFVDTGSYYVFYDRINADKYADLWKPYYGGLAPMKYISCSPKKSDTDGDGMDDYYELFHGLNPLLGADAELSYAGSCDIVFDAWYVDPAGSPISALDNIWIKNAGMLLGREPRTNDPKNNKFDFELFPWLNGLESADADGDDLRNQDEAIMPKMAPQAHHTDPSALWFTDTSYTNSLVSRFYRLPATYTDIVLPGATFEYGEKTYSFSDADGYWVDDLGGKHLAPFTADYWLLTSGSSQNWMYSFEENEGYDTDHDGISDFEELQGKPTGTVSDPQESDSPHNRQAMYFAGEANPSALQSMPFLAEGHPRYGWIYPDDMSFLQYTVECWVRPEEVDAAKDYTVLERAIWSSYSAAGDEELLRKNFQIAIRKGCWYTKFDANGTLEDSTVELQSTVAAKPNEWAHVAATYDGAILRLYVNGVEVIENGVSGRGLKPEYGSSAVIVHPGEDATRTNGLWLGRADKYWWDREYPLHAFIIGASAKNQKDLGGPTKRSNSHLNVTNGRGWDSYKDFFKGYIDEVRVWDGARASDKIKADMMKRYTAADAKANRDDFYDQWSQGRYRYDKDGSGKDQNVIPELRYHWSFDSLPGAENAEMAAKAAHGYGYVDSTGATQGGSKAPLARPIGYEIGWWKTVLDGYEGTVYGNPAYVTWVPNTVTHLPRFDGSTLDSFFWAQDTEGIVKGTHSFAQTAEPVSRWVQYQRQGPFAATADGTYVDFRTTPRRFWQVNVSSESNAVDNASILFEFTGRHLNQMGDDLLPLGGAFVKYVDEMWDEQGPSTASRITGTDDDNDGLPNWWDDPESGYAVTQGYVAKGTVLTWNTLVDYHGRSMTAGDAYLLDLAKGVYVDKDGNVKTDTTYQDKADEDHDGIPDWWELLTGIHNGDTKPTPPGHADGDPDNDGLSNYQEYLVSYGAAPYGFYDLDPTFARSGVKDQKVTDYFLPVTVEDPLNRIFKGEYLGAILTDHDFMEDWWENKYAKDYTSAKIYDPWDDTDGDGWSNFAECRAFMWGGAFASDIIDRWLDGETTENNNRVLDYPRPAIGVKITYANDQINDIDGKGLIVRTRTTGKRVDATFVIHGTDAETVEAQDHMIGSFYEGVTIHGFLNPGWLLPNDVKLYMVEISAADIYTWRYYYEEDYKNKDWDNYRWEDSGPYEAYRAAKRSYRWVRLISPEIQWGDPIAMVHSDKDAHFGELLYTGEAGASTKIGTVDFYTGEYTLDLARLQNIDSKAENSIFKFAYSYKIGKNWPQTLWLSDTFDANNAEDETTGNFVNGSGRVREGLNTIEAFIDYNNNGRWDSGEPYGMVKDVPVGWHKVPEITLELTDESLIVPRTLIPAASTSTGDDQFGAGQQDAAADKDGGGGATTATKVRIVRDSINGIPSSAVVISGLEFVMDDRAYLTEADVMSATSPDLDWDALVADADKLGIVNIASATYHIESYGDSADDSTVAPIGQPFTRRFSDARPVVAPVAPLADAPVYTAAPTFQFTADKDTTAFAIQVADEDGTIIYDSGVQMLGGRASVTVGNYAYRFTAPIYANASIVTNGAPVLVDGKTYKWRAAAFNAKFNTVKPSDYCVWTSFQMDVGNVNRYPVKPMGYGRVGAIVRYFGPAKTNDLTNLIVVEAFENADFTGQALAQIRVADLTDISDATARIDTLDCTNAVLAGLDIGTVYLRAYIDLNNNGKWDRYEPWGYANMVGEYGTDYSYPPIYNPKGIEVGASAANLEKPNFTTIFIEDTDLDKNEIPDCLESWPDPIASDWWTWSGTTEDHPEYVVAGDVMAYAEVDRVMVVFSDGTSALVAKGAQRPTVGDTAVSCNNGNYDSWYRYGDQIGLGLPVTVTDTALRITSLDDVKVVLVHAQVYDEFGYDMKTANAEAFDAGIAVNTKPFTAADKKRLLSYLEAIGFINESDLPKNTDKTFEDYLDELARTDAVSACRLWQKYSLKVGDPDNNRDGVADGWQLYVMFNGNQVAASTPWTSAAAARTVTPGGEGLTWVQEYEGGHCPTDPWQASTLKDTYTTDEGTFTISDKDAYAYHLKHYAGEEGDKYADFDNDGLCNYDEFVIMKNRNRTLDADKMFSYFGSVTIPSLTGQCVPDYFLKSQLSNAAASDLAGRTIKDYLGFDYTSHDFIESWWKDKYQAILPNSQEKYVDRTRFEPYADPDADGWDNWSEARAKTDPTKVMQSSIDGYTINEFPVPIIELSLVKGDSAGASNSAIIVQARLSSGADGQPDATWNVGGRAAGAQEKFLGFNPAIAKSYNLGGAIVPGSFTLGFKDLTADHETYLINTNDSKKTRISSLKVSVSENVWAKAVVDTKVDNNSSRGYLVDRNDGNTIYGTIDYETGDVTIDFAAINEDNGGNGCWRTWNEDQTECVLTYYWKSYVRASWETRATALSASSFQSVILSDAETGRLRQGLNTFVAFADANGNGEYDPGEPFGCAKDVQVGFDKVVDLSINLTKTSPVLPRFDPMAAAGDGGSTNGAVTVEYKGKPVISDLTADATVRIIRWEINGQECAHRTVLSKTAEALGTITEADVLSTYSFDLDWNNLETDAAKIGCKLDDVRTITYAVFVDGGTLSKVAEENVTGWIVKSFSGIRDIATPVSPAKGETAIVTATRPTFEFAAPEGYPAFAFELCDKDGNVVFTSTEHIGAKNAAGNVTYRPPVFFEENGEYTWRVALLNAKYRHAGDWSDEAAFTVELAKGKVHDTDKGMLDVVVRYYGDAPVDAEHPIIVQAFRTADFTGIPEGQTAITSTDLLNSYDNTNAVNAKIYGLAAGEYYICAFIDTTNDVKRMRWESWGYVNNVGTDKADLYTPVATKVMRNDTSTALLFIEDMDCNNDEIPDWMDPEDIEWVWPWPEPEEPSPSATPPTPVDPNDPDDPHGDVPSWFPHVDPVAGDVMAYRDIEDVLLVTIGGIEYAVMDLAGEGMKLRDSDIALQTMARDLRSLVSTWSMGRYVGIGTNVTFTGDEKVTATRLADIRLVHAQVYADQGFDTLTANGQAYLAGTSVNTKPFTYADKYFFCRYLENIGVEGVGEDTMLAEVKKALKGVAPADWEMVARSVWCKYTLDPDEIDMDRDDVADGWEAYVMFGTTGLKRFTGSAAGDSGSTGLADLKISPFKTTDGMLVAPGEGSQLKLVEEFDGGYLPTDPWSNDTDGDSVTDYYAYQYHLKGNDAGEDFDGDGLSNYAEYLISEVFRYAKLDPENPKTDGACVDYFRKMGDLYVGEIFTDHDQVDDVWEGVCGTDYANRDLYDPNRDDDKDGWSNYAEFRAGTDPSKVSALGVTGANDTTTYTKNEYPIPVIEAKVVYNGDGVNLGSIVFKAWNEAKDRDLTSAPDAIWSIGNGGAAEGNGSDTGAPSTETGSTAVTPRKYVGRKPSGVQSYQLSGGSIESGSITVQFLDQQFVRYDSNDVAVARNATSPKDANWYAGVWDKNGKLYDYRDREVGSVNYDTGLLTLDCDKLTGSALGLPNSTDGDVAKLIVNKATAGNTGGQYYDTISLDSANLLISWSAVNVKLTAEGTYYLADADGVNTGAKSHGHVREGLNTFICFADENANGAYDPGEPFGVVRGVDVGWQSAKFTVELTKTSPIFSRVNLYTEDDDRAVTFSEKVSDGSDYIGNKPRLAKEGLGEHIRIVPYMVTGTNLKDSPEDARRGFRYLDRGSNPLVAPRVVAEFDISPNEKPVLTEADFLKDGAFDIDWEDCANEITGPGNVSTAVGSVTAIRYRIVFGENGPVGGSVAEGAGATIETYPYLIERRFDADWAAPKCEGVIGGGDVDPAGVVYTAHPTFVWSMPNESPWAKRYGSSYTAFRITVSEGTDLVYDSGVVRAPKQDEKGYFVWTAPISVGDQTPQGKIFKNSTIYRWNVVMYNAKFKPGAENEKCWAGGGFSTSVNTQQLHNDTGFSSIGVTVKYVGPIIVLDGCEDPTRTITNDDGATIHATQGIVRVQAFTTADFSGVPAAETFVADRTALTDVTDVLANARLTGLAAGTYHIRAYIDMNGNFEKDGFESWGYAKEPVTVGPEVAKIPAVSLYIEDADTNGNWYPDAWEYAFVEIGNWSHGWADISGSNSVKMQPDGEIKLAKAVYDQMTNGMASVSTGLAGSKITVFQDAEYAALFLKPYVTGRSDKDIATTFDAIRKAVEKKVVDKTLKITAITLDTAKSQVILAMDAETDYANLVAGNFATRLYDLDAMRIDAACTVKVQVWKKSTLVQENWELVGEFKKTFGRGETAVEVPVKDNGAEVDPSSGFYMIKVVQ